MATHVGYTWGTVHRVERHPALIETATPTGQSAHTQKSPTLDKIIGFLPFLAYLSNPPCIFLTKKTESLRTSLASVDPICVQPETAQRPAPPDQQTERAPANLSHPARNYQFVLLVSSPELPSMQLSQKKPRRCAHRLHPVSQLCASSLRPPHRLDRARARKTLPPLTKPSVSSLC